MRENSENENGSVTVIALVILMLLTITGISVSRITTLDIVISANERIHKSRFYVIDGGVGREAQELGNGRYRVKDTGKSATLATEDDGWLLPPPVPHAVDGVAYDFYVDYIGSYLPPKGYSATDFRSYYFEIGAGLSGSVSVTARYDRVGPVPD